MTRAESREDRQLRALAHCKHNIPADQCADCAGRVANPQELEEVAERLLRNGHLIAELEEPQPDGGRKRSRLTTLVGIGLGATVILGGLFLWQDKRILRFIKKKS